MGPPHQTALPLTSCDDRRPRALDTRAGAVAHAPLADDGPVGIEEPLHRPSWMARAAWPRHRRRALRSARRRCWGRVWASRPPGDEGVAAAGPGTASETAPSAACRSRHTGATRRSIQTPSRARSRCVPGQRGTGTEAGTETAPGRTTTDATRTAGAVQPNRAPDHHDTTTVGRGRRRSISAKSSSSGPP
jgi:hypothetical protein